jgi:hypothetical protein
MKRRDFLFSAGALAALGLAVVDRRTAQAQTAGRRPISVAAIQTPQGLVNLRLYAGRNRREMLALFRSSRGDVWSRVGIPADAAALSSQLVAQGRFDVTVAGGARDIEGSIALSGAGDLRDFTIVGPRGQRLRGQVTVPPEEPPSGSNPIGLGGVVIAVLVIFGILAIAAMEYGYSAKFEMTTRPLGLKIELEPGPTPPSGSVIWDPICDTMPPMNC